MDDDFFSPYNAFDPYIVTKPQNWCSPAGILNPMNPLNVDYSSNNTQTEVKVNSNESNNINYDSFNILTISFLVLLIIFILIGLLTSKK